MYSTVLLFYTAIFIVCVSLFQLIFFFSFDGMIMLILFSTFYEYAALSWRQNLVLRTSWKLQNWGISLTLKGYEIVPTVWLYFLTVIKFALDCVQLVFSNYLHIHQNLRIGTKQPFELPEKKLVKLLADSHLGICTVTYCSKRCVMTWGDES